MSYQTTADILCQRILDLIPENPEILNISSSWELFEIKGFKCDDLKISLAQAMQSLSKARNLYKLKKGGNYDKTN